MRRLFVSIIAISLVFPALAFTNVDSGNFFEATFNNMPEEVEEASSEGKNLVIMYEQAGCPFCWKMHRDVLNRKEVHDVYAKSFRVIHMDIRGSLETVDFDETIKTQKDFSIGQNVRLTPVFIFYSDKGKEIHRLIGYYDKKEFLLTAKFITSGAYKKEDFFLWLKKEKAKKAE